MITTSRFHLSKGGTEKVMIDLANSMHSRGHNVSILYHDIKGSTPGFELNNEIKTINCAGIKQPFLLNGIMRSILSFNLDKTKRRKKNAELKLKKLAYIYGQAIKNTPADIYITYEPKLSAMLYKEFGISGNIITTFQFSPQHIANRIDTKYLEEYICSAGPIQVLRQEFISQTRKLLPHSNIVFEIPNAIDQRPEKSELKNKIIINIGRVVPQKNQLLLVEAFSLIHNKYKDWRIEIWGEENIDCSYRQKIQDIIHKNAMENQVFLCGPTDNIYDKLINSSIFAFPSIHEGFGLALGEAMSVGLPSIGLENCAAVNTLIKHKINGLLCKATKEDLAESLEYLIKNEDQRKKLGTQAKILMKDYAPSKIWDQWESALLKFTKK